MSNWASLTGDDLKASGHGAIMDQAETLATGGISPIDQAIANSVARTRGACSAGNALDVDTSKVPNSLRGLTIDMALFALMERIGLPLTEDQRETRKTNNSYLRDIAAQKLRFEVPDDSAGSGEMQTAGGIITQTSTNRDHYTRQGMNGL